MRKEDFLYLVYKKCKVADVKEIRDVYDGMMVAIEEAVLDGEEVILQGICSISAKYKPGRTGRNPRTGEAVEIDDRMSPKAKMMPTFRKKVADMKIEKPAAKEKSTRAAAPTKNDNKGRDSGRGSGRRR